MADVEVFSAEACPYAHRTRLVLLYKKIDFSLTEIDLANKPDWFAEVSPYGKVPSIRHRGKVIYESAIINEYLDEVFAEPALMPREPAGRALARIWIDYSSTRLSAAAYKLLRENDAARHDELRAELTACIEFMEREGLRTLSVDGPYWLGAAPSLVDFSFYPFFERLCNVERYRAFALPASCTRIAAWIEAMRDLPVVREIANPAAFYIERARAYVKPADARAAAE